MKKLGLSLIVMSLALGCVATKPNEGASGGKGDRWNDVNHPDRFSGNFEYHLDSLPTSGVSNHEAWPSHFWPTTDDSINHRWGRGLGEITIDKFSSAEKYDLAFNNWKPNEAFMRLRPINRYKPERGWDQEYYDSLGPLASHVSTNMGNKRTRDAVENLPCQDLDGDGVREQTCELHERDFANFKNPVGGWWGLCHAWVPAALLEQRPLKPVTRNGVTFSVADMEALIIAAYNRTPSQIIGNRCNAGTSSRELLRDENNRPIESQCRDTNAGSFHVIVSNYLGIQQKPFAMDRDGEFQVWNQPVIGYEIVKMNEVDAKRANEIIHVSGDEYVHNPDATSFREVQLDLHWVVETTPSREPANVFRNTKRTRYHYILELDEQGLIIGGEWVHGESSRAIPDFLWNPTRLREASSVPHLDLQLVRGLIAESRAGVDDAAFENSDEACSDGEDNDHDGFIDCADFDCQKDMDITVCGLDITRENTVELCSDGVDNDLDGVVDCDEDSCRELDGPACPESASDRKCIDFIDNDLNGLTDCEEPACRELIDRFLPGTCGERTREACSDGIDNDGDGKMDCEEDDRFAVCRSNFPDLCGEQTPARCTDGLDNDDNGLIDCEEESCKRAVDCESIGE